MENSKLEKKEKQKSNNPYKDHRKRLKERFGKVGFKGLHDVEKLELLLFFAIPQKDTKPIARDLMEKFGSLARVLEASEEQLSLVSGVTPNSILLIKLFLSLFEEYQKVGVDLKKVDRPDNCCTILKDYYKGVRVERVVVVCIDAACNVLTSEEVCEGDAATVLINVRKLVEIVLKYNKTAAIILAHNHPGGLALPSREDIDSTIEIVRTFRSMGISVVDHFIVNDDDCVSMAQSEKFSYIFY